MNGISWVIAALVGLALVGALYTLVKRRGCGCGCSGCTQKCKKGK